ncbi:SMP-30/gluconolactonase/LRE family protein [Aspergillus saccharolyticus JOP 1030-1]|uniref:Calcium-dependent phosphotriesterase n=1 Tax=Aspergillus saccharolyticus JOP 1030-1 TaxID=1450539 RepID=A0A318Z8H8_9EURO|nr:calcium-dependent phosphotriesterase [Aspergillus saccharolyticus JOP 1030-1]PYH41073.1 calcium-dependent phosphotriesterase [Aspergillus saccharolyticus JOP 1030-1]
MALTLLPYAYAGNISSAFQVYDPGFLNITGAHPTISILLSNTTAFAHEGPVYLPTTNTLYMTSNILTDPTTNQTTIQISKVDLDAHPLTAEIVRPSPPIPNPNGGIAYGDGILYCGLGNFTDPAGLYVMSLAAATTTNNESAQGSYATTPLLTSFYSRPFNSPNDVVVHPTDGGIYFTDPTYGSIQGLRPAPQLPNQVYRFDPVSGNVRVVADGFVKPNGLSFSPDGRVLYVTDTGYALGNGSFDPLMPATIYAYDVSLIHNQPALTHRRVFVMADNGVPDGIKVDAQGNVYAGCGDGVNVWSSGGVLLGKILVEGGVANFAFGRTGEMFLMAEERIYHVMFN